jgi:hypothetical protein
MGNRAVITTPDKKMGIYLHWNGGRERRGVPALLRIAWLPQSRPRPLRLGASVPSHIGNYIIEGWRIVGREFNRYAEQDSYDHASG